MIIGYFDTNHIQGNVCWKSCSVPPGEWNRWNTRNTVIATHIVPFVPLVSLTPRNGTEQDVGISADVDVRELVFCSICSACSAQGVERNRTKPMVWADVYVCSAAVECESGQSQFAPLKLRSLALVPSSGAQSAPSNSTNGSFTVRLFLPRRCAPVRDSRPFRAPAPPVLMRGVSEGMNAVPVPGLVP